MIWRKNIQNAHFHESKSNTYSKVHLIILYSKIHTSSWIKSTLRNNNKDQSSRGKLFKSINHHKVQKWMCLEWETSLYPNQPQGWKQRTTLSPVVKFVMIISPGESTQVLPKIILLTLVGGGTKSRTTPSRFRVTRVLHIKQALWTESSEDLCGLVWTWYVILKTNKIIRHQ